MAKQSIIRTVTNWIKYSILEPIDRAWQWFRYWGNVFKRWRFPILMVLAGLVLFLFVPQGTDLLRGLADRVEGDNEKKYLRLFFVLSSVFWAMNAWYWSRVVYFLDFGFESREQRRYKETTLRSVRIWTPRIIGSCALLVISVALFRASSGYAQPNDPARRLLLWYAGFAFAASLAFLVVVAKRRQWTNNAYNRMQSISVMQRRPFAPVAGVFNVMQEPDLANSFGGKKRLRDLPTGVIVFASTTLLTAFMLFILFSPVAVQETAPKIGTASIFLFAAAGWTALGTLIDIFGLKSRFPGISVLFILAILFSRCNDNHAVRTERPSALAQNRQTISEALQAWNEHQQTLSTATGTNPLFIVSAEGGGIRAAYWTASILSKITDSNPCFPDQLFALSGVSGGSLGSAVYVAQLADLPVTDKGFYCDSKGNRPPKGYLLSASTHAILSQDFLSPVMGTMLYPDLLQRFLPFPIESFDRGHAIEAAWEKAWHENRPDNLSSQTTGSVRFSEPFLSLWKARDARWMPALFLNSTWVETGKRLIVSNVQLLPDDFMDVEDANAFYGADLLRLSTAVHLSARFTYVSPAGTLKKNGTVYGRAVDGGYFENSGETTVMEILKAIDQLKNDDRKEVSERWKDVYPVVIHISNDPVVSHYQITKLNMDPKDKAFAPFDCLNEVLSPPKTLMDTRDARGAYAREAVKWYVEEENFLHFGLCKSRMAIPLGWVISRPVREEMEKQLVTKECDSFQNVENLKSISDRLNKRYRTNTQGVQ